MSEVVQGLELQVTSTNKRAKESLHDLAETLRRLRAQIQGGAKNIKTPVGLDNLTKSIKDLKTSGNGAAIRALKRPMEELRRAAKSTTVAFEDMSKAYQDMIREKFPKLVGKPVEMTRWTDTFSSNEKLAALRGKIRQSNDAIGGPAASGVKQQAAAMRELTNETALSARQAENLAQRYINGRVGLIALRENTKFARENIAAAARNAERLRTELVAGLQTGKLGVSDAMELAQRIRDADQRVKDLKRNSNLFVRAWRAAKNAVSSGFNNAVKSVKNFGRALVDSEHSIWSLVNGMARMARYRIFRALIREISEGFSTGLKNVREYSKAINGLYAQDMAALDNTLLRMKNSLGAALAPAIRALIPLFQRLASLVITVSNYVNQFFALLNGQSTWTRAIEVDAEALENMDHAASGAGKSMKNLLASWDELNIIQSQSGGGAGGGTKEDVQNYLNMFEEVAEFDSRVRGFIDYLRENLEMVDALLQFIILKLAGLSTGAALVVISIEFAFKSGLEAGKAGFGFKETLQQNLKWILAGALGGALLGFTTTGNLGGALVGAVVGASISIMALGVGWMKGQASTDEEFAENLKATLFHVMTAALVGAGLGFAVGLATGHPLMGALFGFTLFAAIDLALNLLNWDETAGMRATVQKNLTNHLFTTVAGVLEDAIGGALIGGIVGGPMGALVGFSVGAAIGIAGVLFDFDSENSTNSTQNGFWDDVLEFISDHFLLITGAGFLGFTLGGVPGAIGGLAVGVGISLIINAVKHEARKSEEAAARRKQFYETVESMRQEIQDWVSEEAFGVDTVANIRIVNAQIETLEAAKRAMEGARDEFTQAWDIAVRVGLENMTPDELATLNRSAQTLVEKITGYLAEENTTIQLGLSIYGDKMSSEEFDILTNLSAVISDNQRTIQQLGRRLGEILASGTTEGYEEVIDDIKDILLRAGDISYQAAAQAHFNATVMAAPDTGNPVQDMTAFQSAFNTASNDLRLAAARQVEAEDAALREALGFAQLYATKTDAELQAMGITDKTQADFIAEAERLQAELDYMTANYRARIDARYAEMAEGGMEIYRREMLRLWTNIAQANGRELLDENGVLLSPEDLLEFARNGGLEDFTLANAQYMYSILAEAIGAQRRSAGTATGSVATGAGAPEGVVGEWSGPVYGGSVTGDGPIPDEAVGIIRALNPDITQFYGIYNGSYIVGTADGTTYAIDPIDVSAITNNPYYGTGTPMAWTDVRKSDDQGGAVYHGGMSDQDIINAAIRFGFWFVGPDGTEYGTPPERYTAPYLWNGAITGTPPLPLTQVNPEDYPGLYTAGGEGWSVPSYVLEGSDIEAVVGWANAVANGMYPYDYEMPEWFVGSEFAPGYLHDGQMDYWIYPDNEGGYVVYSVNDFGAGPVDLQGDTKTLVDEWFGAHGSPVWYGAEGGYGNGGGGMPSGYVPGGTDIGAYVGTNYGIVNAGSAPGVSEERDDSEEERNATLRTLVGLVQRVANKEWTVELKPSANFGRFTKQSADMYASAKG